MLQQSTTTFSYHQVKRASLVDSRTEVNDVKFAPKHLGLQLVREALNLWCSFAHDEHNSIQATCSTDGQLRIYEAPDVMNLSQWSLLVSLVW